MSAITAVTFDFWWTLFKDDTDAGVADNWRLDHVLAALRAAGYGVERERLRAAIQQQRLHGLRVQEKRGEEFPPEAQVRGWLQTLDLPSQLFGMVFTPYISPYTELDLPVMDHALATLAALARRYRLAVICNTGSTPGSVLRQVVGRAGLAPYLQVQTYSNEEGLAKPRPEIFQRTLQRLGAEPAETVHVGDNGRTDVTGARTAGLSAIWLRSHPGAAPPRPGAALAEITTLAEISPLLLRLESNKL